jgi:hypothetical protein
VCHRGHDGVDLIQINNRYAQTSLGSKQSHRGMIGFIVATMEMLYLFVFALFLAFS